MKQSIRFCTSSDGVKLAYAVTAAGDVGDLAHPSRAPVAQPGLEAVARGALPRSHAAALRFTRLRPFRRGIDNLSFETWIKDFEKVIDAAGFGRFLEGMRKAGLDEEAIAAE